MSKRSKYTAEEKLKILMEYTDGCKSKANICYTFGIAESTFDNWRYNYESYGIDGLKESKTWKDYSKVLKDQAVLEYISGSSSYSEIVKKYEISGKSTLALWVKKYNSHRELKATMKGLSRSMANRKSTSWKERIEIVLYCVAHNHDYQKTAEAHQVSYQQVYQWVKKYEAGGEDALKDRRGRKKDVKELTTEEKIDIEMKKLKAENEMLKAENAFLKKLEQLERGRF